jgi:hypothetical protein
MRTPRSVSVSAGGRETAISPIADSITQEGWRRLRITSYREWWTTKRENQEGFGINEIERSRRGFESGLYS